MICPALAVLLSLKASQSHVKDREGHSELTHWGGGTQAQGQGKVRDRHRPVSLSAWASRGLWTESGTGHLVGASPPHASFQADLSLQSPS